MEEKFIINMTKKEMLRYYANKIVEDGIKSCSEFGVRIDIWTHLMRECIMKLWCVMRK